MPANMPAAKNVMMFKFLNRTNGQFPDSNVFWSVKIKRRHGNSLDCETSNSTTCRECLGQDLCLPGSVGTNTNNYHDFLEYTIGAAQFNGNTTRVDAFGIKLAMRLHCADGFEATVGENLPRLRKTARRPLHVL